MLAQELCISTDILSRMSFFTDPIVHWPIFNIHLFIYMQIMRWCLLRFHKLKNTFIQNILCINDNSSPSFIFQILYFLGRMKSLLNINFILQCIF